MIVILCIVLAVVAILVTALIRTKIWNEHKKIVTSGEMTEDDYQNEVEQFGIYTPDPTAKEEQHRP